MEDYKEPNIIRIIEKLYQDTECAVIIDRNLTKWFHNLIGDRQSCFIFLQPFLHSEKKTCQNVRMSELKLIQTNFLLI